MKFIIILFISSTTLISTNILDDVRKDFIYINSLEQVNNLEEQLEKEHSIESKGYLASMNFIKANYYSSPFKKIKYFNRGKNSLDSLVEMNPENIELRYLRFLMQKKTPSFLGYNNQIDADFIIIINGIENKSLSDKLNSLILINLLTIDNLSAYEKKEINLLLEKQ